MIDDAPPMLNGHAYLAVGRELFHVLNDEIAAYFDSSGIFDHHGVEHVLTNVETRLPNLMEGRRQAARDHLEAIALRGGNPVSPQSQELLERDAAQDAANRRTGLVTRLIELEHLRDAPLSPKDYDKWRRDLDAFERELGALPANEQGAVRQEARQALADRD